ncbi:MAG: MBL fold metallo-hydrolase [Burkholderiaceae bacterium]|nr:MBL fold metallo-hydrolase [Burkholderiaceae bacterium]
MPRARWILVGLATLALLVLSSACTYPHPKFGAEPEGERLERARRSPQYADGEFRNPVPTPVLVEGQSTLAIIVNAALDPAPNLRPTEPVPVVRTDLKALDPRRDTIVWLGHSFFFVLFAGQRILVDPVFSPYAAPVPFSNRAFEGTTLYAADDLPDIDLLLITHDHWDHLDYDTITALQPKVAKALVPLGVGAHLEHWGYAPGQIDEADWYDTLSVEPGFDVHVVPARHYSGRLLTRNKTLWAGFVLESSGRRLLFGGDSGYGPHYEEIGRRFGGFDLVALDMGQYDPRWPLIHMTPEEAAQAAVDLNAQALLPAHVGRFSIARHPWNEPFERISRASAGKPYRLLTPPIGGVVHVD